MTPHIAWSGATALARVVGHGSTGIDWVAAQFWIEVVQATILALAGGFTFAQVRQARLSRLSQYRPFVIVYAQVPETAHHMIQIVIENIGVTPARNIKFSFSPELESTLTASASGTVPPWSALESGIKFLAPGQKIVHLFDSLIQRYASTLRHQYGVAIQYDSKERKKLVHYEEKYDIDFGDWYGSNFRTVFTIHDVAESLREIQRQMGNWTEDNGVRVFDTELNQHRQDRDSRRQAFLAKQEHQDGGD